MNSTEMTDNLSMEEKLQQMDAETKRKEIRDNKAKTAGYNDARDLVVYFSGYFITSSGCDLHHSVVCVDGRTQ